MDEMFTFTPGIVKRMEKNLDVAKPRYSFRQMVRKIQDW